MHQRSLGAAALAAALLAAGVAHAQSRNLADADRSVRSTRSVAPDRNRAAARAPEQSLASRVSQVSMRSGSSALVVCSTDVGQDLTDLSSVTSLLDVPFAGRVADVDLVLDVTHPCVAALEFRLTAPDGTEALVIDSYVDGGILLDLGCASAFTDTTIDDEAPVNLADGSPPYSGSFNAAAAGADPLSTFDGTELQGNWALTVSDEDEAGDLGTLVGWCLVLTVEGAAAPVACSADVGQGIVDNSSVTSTQYFPVSGEIIDLDLELDVTHTCGTALRFDLTAPSGTTARVIEASGAGGILSGFGCLPGFPGTIIDDEAPVGLEAGAPDLIGRYSALHPSADPLSIFDGGEARGTWSLRVEDTDGFGDAGTLNGWCITVVVRIPASCPGDADGDGDVAFNDLLILLTNFGPCP